MIISIQGNDALIPLNCEYGKICHGRLEDGSFHVCKYTNRITRIEDSPTGERRFIMECNISNSVKFIKDKK